MDNKDIRGLPLKAYPTQLPPYLYSPYTSIINTRILKCLIFTFQGLKTSQLIFIPLSLRLQSTAKFRLTLKFYLILSFIKLVLSFIKTVQSSPKMVQQTLTTLVIKELISHFTPMKFTHSISTTFKLTPIPLVATNFFINFVPSITRVTTIIYSFGVIFSIKDFWVAIINWYLIRRLS